MMWIFAHVNSPSGLARIFILHAHIHATREVTLSAEDLTTMSGGRQQEHTSPMQSIFTHQSIFSRLLFPRNTSVPVYMSAHRLLV